jgi:hypothetical protein
MERIEKFAKEFTMVETRVLDYYRRQSMFTDPGTCAVLYDDLPHDIAGLARVVQGTLIAPYVFLLQQYHVEPDEIDNTRFGLHRVEALLQRIQQRQAAPLTVARPPALRIGAICRNFAVLLVSMLRHQGVPARLRVGFGGYFSSPRFYDHRIAEYWHEGQQRWILADPWIDDMQRQLRNIAFDTLDIGPDDPYRLAGDAWLRCRSGELNPDSFGDSDTDIGMPPIRYALLHDFAALNKLELLGNDDRGELLTKPEADLTDDDLVLLDRIAALTTQVDTHFDELLALFEETAYGQTVRAYAADLPPVVAD